MSGLEAARVVAPDGALLRSWAHRGLAALGEARAEIDALNVFPVPDGDTGTNLYLTQEAACAAMEQALDGRPDPDAARDAAAVGEAFAQGALLGARGNSGIILSQLVRGFVDGLTSATAAGRPAAVAVADALGCAARSAYDAVATPVEGTVLTVAREAAEQAARTAAAAPEDLVAVVSAAARAAREALERTPQQLAALARAGVVDSGGRGLVVLYDALEEVVTGVVHPPSPRPLPEPVRSAAPEQSGGAYEVMYLLDAPAGPVSALRDALAALGDSVVVVGADRLWNVHVHTDDVGAAIEAGIEAGRPYRIRVTALREVTGVAAPAGRAVVVVTHGPGMAELLGSHDGVVTVAALPRQAPSTGELLDGIRRAGAAEVVVLTSDSDVHPAAEAAARAARDEGLRVAVIPTRSVVQSLAAVAVHQAGLAFDDDVIGMTRAAHETRYGAVTTAVRAAITMAGPCRPGDVLGIVEGDVAEIGAHVPEVALRVLDRLLQAGGEQVTVVTGQDEDGSSVAGVRRHLRQAHPGVELEVFHGGQPYWPLILGVE